jgi:hypothetical protein
VKKKVEEREGKKNESIIYKKNNESFRKKKGKIVQVSNMHTFVICFLNEQNIR